MLSRFIDVANNVVLNRYLKMTIQACIIISLCIFVVILFSGDPKLDKYMPLTVAIFSWCTVLLGWSYALQQMVLEKPERGFWLKVGYSLKRGLHNLMTVLFIATTVILIYMSFKAINFAI